MSNLPAVDDAMEGAKVSGAGEAPPKRHRDPGSRGPSGRKPPGRKPSVRSGKPADEKAQEIARRSGLPLPLACEVAAGKCTLNEALHRLMKQEKAERLARQHGLSLPGAMKVISGVTTLEWELLLLGLETCEARQPDRSVLLDLRTGGGEGVFFLFGEEPFTARVTAVEKYDVVLDSGGSPEGRRLEKHEIRFVSPELTAEEVAQLAGMDPAVAGQDLGPSKSYRDRFRSSKKVLFKHYRDRIPTRVVFRDGTVLTGFVGWFGKWEFELLLIDPRKKNPSKAKPAGSVVIFRHAMRVLAALE